MALRKDGNNFKFLRWDRHVSGPWEPRQWWLTPNPRRSPYHVSDPCWGKGDALPLSYRPSSNCCFSFQDSNNSSYSAFAISSSLPPSAVENIMPGIKNLQELLLFYLKSVQKSITKNRFHLRRFFDRIKPWKRINL